MGADAATTVVQAAFLMRLANEIKLYHTPICLYSKVLIISHQALLKTIAIALPLLQTREFECLIPCVWSITEGRAIAKTDERDFVPKLSGRISTEVVFRDRKKAQLLFSSLSFNLLLRKAQGSYVCEYSVEDIIFSFSEDCVQAWGWKRGLTMCNKQGERGHYTVLLPKCSAQVGQKHIRIIQNDYSTCKEQKILQISEARKVLEGILINVHKVVGLLNSSAKRQWNIRGNISMYWS